MRYITKRWALLPVLFFVTTAQTTSSCGEANTDIEQARATEQMVSEAQAQVGMPDIINFTERRNARDILELRDKPDLATYTYITDMNGQLHPLCRSIGYGLPYSVQFTNPERLAYRTSASATLPQPDPNGLFMPDGLSATWVLCVDPATGEPEPLYVEPQIIVSRFELTLADWDNPGN